VISYDIVDNRKRNKAADTLKDYGFRVQKSVFECRVDYKSLTELLGKIKKIIDRETDSILIYPLCENCLQQKTSVGVEVDTHDEDFCVL
jgi:CRISPR-associated protein Cas2